MAYTLDAFVKDAQAALGGTAGPAGREKVRVALLTRPGSEARLPALHAALGLLPVFARKVGADAEHGLDGNGLCDHVTGVTPGVAPGRRWNLER